MPGPKPRGDHALTPAERNRAYRERLKAERPVVVRFRKPADRRSRQQQWADAVQTLLSVLDAYQDWRDALPPGVAESPTADRLDAVLELRGLVYTLEAAELPKGFGRD
jgi:hypothetical protein